MPELLEYTLSSNVRAFTTKRHGGFSKGAYAGFNISKYSGDNSVDVLKNRKLLCMELGIDDDCLIYPHQTHGAEVKVLDGAFFALSASCKDAYMEDTDALVTDERGVCIGVLTADCVPLLITDSSSRVVAAVHAGWRGTVSRIVLNTVDIIRDRWGIDPSRLNVAMGPAIGFEAFEVGDEVYEVFSSAGFQMGQISGRISGKWHIDLCRANMQLLLSSGVPYENIHISDICTFSNYDTYFSARKSGTASGRIFSGIQLL